MLTGHDTIRFRKLAHRSIRTQWTQKPVFFVIAARSFDIPSRPFLLVVLRRDAGFFDFDSLLEHSGSASFGGLMEFYGSLHMLDMFDLL